MSTSGSDPLLSLSHSLILSHSLSLSLRSILLTRSIIPEANNFRHFFVTIAGPAGTAYAGGMFKLEMYLPEEYPMVPPKVHFLTRVYHPNIDRVGRICLDILKVSITLTRVGFDEQSLRVSCLYSPKFTYVY